GRDFGPEARAGGERGAILGEAAARRFWPDAPAVGQFIVVNTAGVGDTPQATPMRIVGVAKDVGTGGRRGDVPLALYVPFQQHYLPQVTILARREGSSSLAGNLHVLITDADSNLPVLAAQTLE